VHTLLWLLQHSSVPGLQEHQVDSQDSIYIYKSSVSENTTENCMFDVTQKGNQDKKNRQLKQLRMKLNVLVEKDGVQVVEQFQKDLEKVADVHSVMEEDEFKKIFWQQQVCRSYQK